MSSTVAPAAASAAPHSDIARRSRITDPELSGIFAVYKPRGVTTRDMLNGIVEQLTLPSADGRRIPQRERMKAGHGGTLDKQAEGVVIIASQGGTKQLASFLEGEKEYLVDAMLGVDTDTHDLDQTSTVLKQASFEHVTREALESFLSDRYAAESGGMVSQLPPLFSALKQDGMRLSSMVRAGKVDSVNLDAKDREVFVRSIQVTGWRPPHFSLRVQCGGGFYVRSLLRDIGDHFNCGAVMTRLQRTKQCGFDMHSPHTLDFTHLAHQRTRTAPAVQSQDVSTLHQVITAAGLVDAPSMTRPATLVPFSRDAVARVLAVPIEQRRVAQESPSVSGCQAGLNASAAAASSVSSSSASSSSAPMPADAAAVFDFWFLPASDPKHDQSRPEWWKKDPAFDQQIREKFGALIERGLKGELSDWSSSGNPKAALAFILLMDQFTRNIFRGDKKSFAGDAYALAVAKEMVKSGADKQLSFTQRVYVYMPFMHSESLADQDECIRLFNELAKDQGKDPATSESKYAKMHRDIIQKWGRFPHRNEMLGRQSTPEEIEFLKTPGSSF
jgi:tRNA pseudouridine(55) synthase